MTEQEAYFWQAAGVARYAWNWALGEYNRRKTEGLSVKIVGKGETLKSEFTALKKTDCPWLADVTSYAYQAAFIDMQRAISRYWKLKKEGQLEPPKGWKGRKDGRPFGWPRFKSKRKCTPSFYLANNGCFRLDGHWVRIQKCPDLVNMAEELRFNGKAMGARVTYQHGHWWLSVQVEVEHEPPQHDGGAVGIDLGVKYLAVTSDGQEFHNPKALQRAQRKLRRLQRKLDRQRRANNPDNYNADGMVKKGPKEWTISNNMRETEGQIAKLHYRVACIRNEASHTMTTEIARRYSIIGIEDLNVNGMLKNHSLAKAISDAALYEKRRQLEYKSAWNGGVVVPIDMWFPSSKRCNECGWINVDLKLSDRQWTCQNCGVIHPRDGNASKNIRDEALRLVGLNANSSPDYSDGEVKRLNANSDGGLIVGESTGESMGL